MRHVVGVIAGIALLFAQLGPVAGQPMIPDDPAQQESGPKSSGASAKIPIAMPNSAEVLGGEAATAAEPATDARFAPKPISLEQPIDPDHYICGPGDVFELDFWGQQNFRMPITADLEGRAFISRVGFVAVGGKTLTQVRKEVQRKVRGDYPGLQFELTLVTPRTFLVHVVDNVKHPGSYPAHPLERVSVVLASAGDVTGSRRRIAIHHRTGGDATADLVLYELTGDTSYDPYVLDGDVISVPFAQVTVAITGAVHRPGSYELIKTKDLAELLDLAGGFTSTVARSLPIRIVRRDAQDRAVAIEAPFDGATTPNHELRDLDQVDVHSTDELQRSVLLIGAFVGADPLDPATTSRRLPYVEGDTVLSLVNRAGGIRAPGDLHRSYISRPRAEGPPELIPIDLEALLVKRDFAADRSILMNDTIVIPPMQYSVLVEGAVARAGLYPFNPQFGITQYIAHAGGRTRFARDLDEVKLIDWSGKTHDFQEGMKLSPGDAILVPERDFSRAEIVQLVLAGAGLVLSGVAVAIAATR